MGDLPTFSPALRACGAVSTSDNPVDQQDDITVVINSGQTNRFSAMNKNRLAKYNFWR
jgi:hypothetical protein